MRLMKRPVKMWQIVSCPICGKTSCEAAPGSTIKFFCKKCKVMRVVSIAA